MSERWKYPTETVTVGPNSVTVRGMTFGERIQFAAKRKEQKDAGDQRKGFEMTGMLAKFGIVEPKLTDQEISEMPGDLLEAAVEKIMALSGMKADPKEKKAETEPAAAPETLNS